ncbi:MAG: hypothetical protein L0I76_02035 [Pseudonocardia sp.]|nr:hypothetical protein [Pseudonocardia sp.]
MTLHRPVLQGVRDLGGLVEVDAGDGPVTLDQRHPRHGPQRLAALLAAGVETVQQPLDPATAVGEEPAGDPVIAQQRRQPRARLNGWTVPDLINPGDNQVVGLSNGNRRH